MSDKEYGDEVFEKPFYVDRAKTGRAGCKKCKQKIPKGELRFAKVSRNPFGSGTMKQWHHIHCIFEHFSKQRSGKKIESPDDVGGWQDLSENDKQEIMLNFDSNLRNIFKSVKKVNTTPSKKPERLQTPSKINEWENHKDNSFRAFRKLCVDLSNDNSYLTKTKIVAEFFDKGTDGDFFKGNVELWCKLLLPGAIGRTYNLRSKQLIKLFSRILGTNQEEMLVDLEKGDAPATICTYFEKSKIIKPSSKSTLTLQEVDNFLEKLSKMTKEDEQIHHFTKITQKCTPNDLKIILRLIKHDLRITAGPKFILDALHKDAYKAFQTSRDLKTVVANALKAKEKVKDNNTEEKGSKNMEIGISMMTPVLPMLAQVCKSVEMAFQKFPNGMFSEIKYDGERVQLHKQGNSFKYFSRNLKPVLAHKIAHFNEYIPQAFPHGKDLILDGEILMIDTVTGKPLPFGTLGIHKKTAFKNANVCLFVFDCLFYNGVSLLKTSIVERKKILKKNMIEVKNHIMLSEMEKIHKIEELEKMINKVFKNGLEGLVLKDLKSAYEPGKRHWLKIKKDYLFDGAIADTADLVVLGAWFGTGSKGGIMSSFLMGCLDPKKKKWVTVTKVSGGHDFCTLEKLQKELKVLKISRDPSKVPSWLNCTKTMIPDFVAADPEKMPVWEITGAEFTCNKIHTADGISIRFPRVTKIRDDKDWSSATNLDELKTLYNKSKETADFNLCQLTNNDELETPDVEDEGEPTVGEKRKKESEEPEEKFKKAKTEDDELYLVNTDTDTDSEIDEEFEILNFESVHESMQSIANITNPLHDVFTNCIIQIPKDYHNYNFLRRYIIAYGGVLHDTEKNNSVENAEEKVTHVVHLSKVADLRKEKIWAENVCHVHVNWIWDSIKLLEKQPECRYIVAAKDGD